MPEKLDPFLSLAMAKNRGRNLPQLAPKIIGFMKSEKPKTPKDFPQIFLESEKVVREGWLFNMNLES